MKARVVSDLTQHKDYFKQEWLKFVTRLLDYLSMNIYIFLTDALSTMNSKENEEWKLWYEESDIMFHVFTIRAMFIL